MTGAQEGKKGINIGAVAEFSGLSVHVIRAWESRYGLLSPERLQNGRRVYTLTDAEYLRNLGILVRHGHQIGRVASMDRVQVQALAAELDPSATKTSDELQQQPTARKFVSNIIYHLERYRLDDIAVLMGRARNELSARLFVLDVVAPLMASIGKLVEEDRLSMVQEHVLSALVRAQLFKLILENKTSAPLGAAKKIFSFVTPEEDHHELGILMAATLASLRGFTVQYLGPNLPATAVGAAAEALRTNYVVIGSTLPVGTNPGAHQSSYLRALHETLPAKCSILIGGRLYGEIKSLQSARNIRYFGSLSHFDEYLSTL